MAFTCSEFPGRTFQSIQELEELQREKHALQKKLQLDRTRTSVEKADSPEDPEHVRGD